MVLMLANYETAEEYRVLFDLINSLKIIEIDKTMEVVPHLQVCY